MSPEEIQVLRDELKAARQSRKRAWDNLQELRWIINDIVGVELPAPARKTIDLEGRVVKDGVSKVVRDRQTALADLVHAVRDYRRLAEGVPLTLQGAEYADALEELNKALERAARLLQ